MAKVNDLALRLCLMFEEVWKCLQGNNFVLDKLIYVLAIKCKTHKRLELSAVAAVRLMFMHLCTFVMCD